jgi:hypothetical protein
MAARGLRLSLPCTTFLVITTSAAGFAQENPRPPAAPIVDVVGTTLRARLPDGSSIEGAALTGATLTVAVGGKTLRIRIASVEQDPRNPAGDVLLYDFRVVTPAGEQPMCEPDPDGRRLGLPIAGRSDPAGIIAKDQTNFELVCTAGPQGKCVRFGYGPWKQTPSGLPMRDWYNSCVRMLRGDYCGDGNPYTRIGTWIDLYDTLDVQKTDNDPSLAFEAGWSPAGAVCVARPRLPDLVTLEKLAATCPRLKDRVGVSCSESGARADGALIFNRSRP